jgi:hypothetical protein
MCYSDKLHSAYRVSAIRRARTFAWDKPHLESPCCCWWWWWRSVNAERSSASRPPLLLLLRHLLRLQSSSEAGWRSADAAWDSSSGRCRHRRRCWSCTASDHAASGGWKRRWGSAANDNRSADPGRCWRRRWWFSGQSPTACIVVGVLGLSEASAPPGAAQRKLRVVQFEYARLEKSLIRVRPATPADRTRDRI